MAKTILVPVVDLDIFRTIIHFTADEKMFDEICGQLTNPENLPSVGFAGKATWMQHENGQMTYVLGVFDENPSTLVHEATHITTFLCDHLGMNMHDSDGEWAAYIMAYIFEQVSPYIKKKAFKKYMKNLRSK